jgi:hypothetical protein
VETVVLENLVVNLLGDSLSFDAMIKNAMGGMDKIVGKVKDSVGTIGQFGSALMTLGKNVQRVFQSFLGGVGLGGITSFSGVVNMLKGAVGKAAAAETVQIKFEAVAGGADNAKIVLDAIKGLAADLPIDVPALRNAASMMLKLGVSAEDTADSLKSIAVLSEAAGVPAQTLARSLAMAFQTGSADMRGVRVLAMSGVPIYLELAKVMGLVGKEATNLDAGMTKSIQKMITQKQISAEVFRQAVIGLGAPGSKFGDVLEREAGSFEGIIKILKNQVADLMKGIGGDLIEGLGLKTILKYVLELFRGFQSWFKEIDPGTKKFLMTMLAVALSVGGLIGAFLLVKALVVSIGAVIATVGWPFLIVAGLIVGAVAMWVDEVGGVQKAMELAKAKLVEFWEYIKPIRQAAVALFQAMWFAAKEVFKAIYNVAKQVWEAVSEQANINWADVRDFIVDVLLVIAFSIRNVSEVANVAFAYMKMKAVDAAYAYAEAWGVAGKIATFIVEKISGLQEQAHQDYQAAFNQTKTNYQDFKAKALGDANMLLAPKDEDKDKNKKKWGEAGAGAGKAFKEHMAKEVKDLNADLFGSAESLRRYEDYLEQIFNPQANIKVGPNGEGRAGGKSEEYLKELRDMAKERQDNPNIDLEGADLNLD